MIIFGTRGVTYNHEKGDFFCPVCKGDCLFKHKRVRRFFTLYFIPCIPLDLLGEYIECQDCQGTFDLAVLEFDPRAEQKRFQAQFHKAIRETMVQMVIADGVVDDAEIATVREIYEGITKQTLDAAALREECASAIPTDIAEVVGSYSATLNDNGKEMVLNAAVQVAASDGDFADEERELAMEIAKALEMSNAHAKGVIAEVLGA
jgi:tellurite resistance protein